MKIIPFVALKGRKDAELFYTASAGAKNSSASLRPLSITNGITFTTLLQPETPRRPASVYTAAP